MYYAPHRHTPGTDTLRHHRPAWIPHSSTGLQLGAHTDTSVTLMTTTAALHPACTQPSAVASCPKPPISCPQQAPSWPAPPSAPAPRRPQEHLWYFRRCRQQELRPAQLHRQPCQQKHSLLPLLLGEKAPKVSACS